MRVFKFKFREVVPGVDSRTFNDDVLTGKINLADYLTDEKQIKAVAQSINRINAFKSSLVKD